MILKKYQKDALQALQDFFEHCRLSDNPKTSYEHVTGEPELAKRLGAYRSKYKALKDIPHIPHVCLRLPTGGGKTLLAAHAIKVLRKTWLEKENPVVLWLVPSNIIREQTVNALKNHRHAYRMALDEAFDNHVRVFDIADFANIHPQDIQQNVCIVVGTIQTLRVTNTEGRKVYNTHEDYEPHFARITRTDGLELESEGPRAGKIKLSFANLMHIHRPLMIVDEAHQAVSNLSDDVKFRINPSAIVEFSATPRPNNNTLYNVTAFELKKAEMIKMPIALSEHSTWQQAVTDALATRAALEKDAKLDKDYIRPLVLFQAQKKNQDVTVEVLKQFLMGENDIPEKQIAIATGNKRELEGIDLYDPNCPIEYVITVEALKEGWDCPFAYVFCSVANISSATDIEQLLGRVLRMPYASRRKDETLNKAYAHVSETTFGAAARALKDTLIEKMGFQEVEADEMIEEREPAQLDLPEGGLFDPRIPPMIYRPSTPLRTPLPPSLSSKVSRRTDEQNDTFELVVTGPLNAEEIADLKDALPEADHMAFEEEAAQYIAEITPMLSPAQRGAVFTVPRLMAYVQDEFVFGDMEEVFCEHNWSLAQYPAELTQKEFDIQTTANMFEIYINEKEVRSGSIGEKDLQLSFDVDVEGWSAQSLVRWLATQINAPDIGHRERLEWCSRLVTFLERRGLNIAGLMRCKFILSRKIQQKIDNFRVLEREKCYQTSFLEPEREHEVSFDEAFEFKDGMFAHYPRYRGSVDFRKHFLSYIPDFDGKGEKGEEFHCAEMLDSLPQVKHWIKNVPKDENAFKLPLAQANFYPDFIAELEDGRIFVVEYKGDDRATNKDSDNKRTIGNVWEKAGQGKCLFLMVEKEKNGRNPREQMLDKISS
ncbi:MAG: DEAD/DEAH box helicase family protein [Methylocystaceae bacterium]|nr:DEAD/DEAH box helicase family protein [Methylocystaceae bacterium]